MGFNPAHKLTARGADSYYGRTLVKLFFVRLFGYFIMG